MTLALRPGRDAGGDAGWVAGIRAGDPAAFEGMFRAYYEVLHAFALGYVGDEDAADEIVQDVLCWIWAHRAGWTVATSLRTYLFGSVRNRVLNYRKHQRVQDRWAAQAVQTHEVLGGSASVLPTDARVEADEFASALRRAIDALPDRCRTAYVLRWVQHQSYREIAGQMGVSVKAVEFHIAKALKRLREDLAGFF